MKQIIVTSRQKKAVIDISTPGPKGDKGDTGAPGTAAAASSTFAGLGTPTAGEVRRVTDNVRGLWYANGSDWISVVAERLNPKAFGAKGNNSADDTVAIQAMATLLATSTSRVSEVEWPPGIYKISAPIDWGYVSGKVIEGAGANPYDGPSLSGTRIVQTADNVPVFKIGGTGLYPRAIRLKGMSLAYDTQQAAADTAAMGIQFTSSDSGPTLGVPHDINLEDISVENACDSIGHSIGSGSTWNTYFKGVRCINQARHGIRFANAAGSPMNHWQDVFIGNTNGGLVPTGYAIEHSSGGLAIDGLDIEGWNNLAIYLFGGWYYAIQNLHIEHHTVSGANPFVIDIADCPLHLRSALFAMHQTAPGSFTGNLALIRVWTGGSIDVNHVRNDMSSLAGTILFVDGPGLDTKSVIGPDIRNTGASTARVLDGTFSAWGTENKLRQDITTAWVTPALGAGWVAVSGYQPPRYRRKGDVVEVEGLAQNTGGGALTSAVFVLPAGFRPALYQTDIGWSGVAATPVVETNGNVVPPSPIANDGYFVTKTSFSVLP